MPRVSVVLPSNGSPDPGGAGGEVVGLAQIGDLLAASGSVTGNTGEILGEGVYAGVVRDADNNILQPLMHYADFLRPHVVDPKAPGKRLGMPFKCYCGEILGETEESLLQHYAELIYGEFAKGMDV